MTTDTAFTALNLAVLPWWLCWLAAPRSRLALRAASHSAVFVALSLGYALFVALVLAKGGFGGSDAASLRAGLASPLGFLAGWTHYLAFDLFVGAWIVREALRLEVEPRPFLMMTLLLGPLGLGAFLVRRALRLRSFGGLGETDLA